MDLEPSRADEGRAWFGDAGDIDGTHSLVDQVPILSGDGTVLAVASVSERYPSAWTLLSGAGERLLIYLGLGAALGMVASWLLSRRIKRHTRGLEVAEIASLADHRQALLHSICEGVIAVNDDGDITVLNDSAQELRGITGAAVGRRVDTAGLDPAVVSFLTSGEDGDDGESAEDTVIATRTRVLALSRRATTSQGQRIGTVTTMRDSTRTGRPARATVLHKSVTDTLRAQTHEFANQLHTISGLVQLGEYNSVRALVGALTRRRAEISDAVTQRISDPAVAALLITKTSLAAESGVALDLDPDSHLAALDPALATDVITLLGNLIDNAVDVSVGSPDAHRRGIQAGGDLLGLGFYPVVGPAAQPGDLSAQVLVELAAILDRQAGRLFDDQGGPPFREHPGLQGGQGVRHLGHQGLGEPQVPVPACRGVVAGQRHLRGQPHTAPA